MKKNMKRMMGWIFTAILICCIGFTTKGVTADAAIVSGGKKNYSYSELQKDLKQLKKKYKNRCQVNVIGKSEDKRNLYEVVIGNPDAKKHLLVMGNLHAREHMTVQLCMKQIEYYLSNYNKKISGKKVSATLNKVAILFQSPVTCCGSGSDCDTSFLLLFHPVHGSSTFMSITNLVIYTSIIKDTLC